MGISNLAYETLRDRVARNFKRAKPPAKLAGGVRYEKDLHRVILLECHRRELLALHGSMAHATHRTAGEPDFVILLPAGRVLLIECKARGGRVSEAQQDFARRALTLEHTVHIINNSAEFISLLKSYL